MTETRNPILPMRDRGRQIPRTGLLVRTSANIVAVISTLLCMILTGILFLSMIMVAGISVPVFRARVAIGILICLGLLIALIKTWVHVTVRNYRRSLRWGFATLGVAVALITTGFIAAHYQQKRYEERLSIRTSFLDSIEEG